MGNKKINLAYAILAVAFSFRTFSSYAQTTNAVAIYSSTTSLASTEEVSSVKNQKEETEKLISLRKDSLTTLIARRDSLKTAIVNWDKAVKRSLEERNILAEQAFQKGVRSKDWNILNQEYKKNIKDFQELNKNQKDAKLQLIVLEQQITLTESDLKNHKLMLNQLNARIKEDSRRDLAKRF